MKTPDLLTANISLYTDGECHIVRLGFEHREQADRAFEWLESLASADTRPKGGDALAAPFTSGAVPKADAPTQSAIK